MEDFKTWATDASARRVHDPQLVHRLPFPNRFAFAWCQGSQSRYNTVTNEWRLMSRQAHLFKVFFSAKSFLRLAVQLADRLTILLATLQR
jgi:hypothetical protein